MPLDLLLTGLAGLLAQMVDGALGMGFGITSASLLLATGMAPALVSASVKFAQLGTTLASGASHWRAGNVDPRIMLRLAVPGGIGALTGALLLSYLSTAAAAPVMSLLLLVLGVLVIIRFVRRRAAVASEAAAAPRTRLLVPLGMVGGLVDATGGGGWGPVVTSTLLTTGAAAPRRVIGSVCTAEFVVTSCASIGFVLGLGVGGFPLGMILALMAGGVIAAPFAARLAGRLPAPILGVCVGTLIVSLNAGTVLAAAGLHGGTGALAHAGIVIACLGVLTRTLLRHRHAARPLESAPAAPAPVPAEVA